MKRINIHLSDKQLKWLNKSAKEEGISRAEFIRFIINLFIKRPNKEGYGRC